MRVLFRGSILQRLRLAAGLILFTFAATHFLNHAVGLFGLDAMQEVQAWRKAVTRSPLGSIILISAITLHIVLALTKLARRTTFRMPTWEWFQILTGLIIPFLLIPHIVNTRVANRFFGVKDTYLYELINLWPDNAIMFTCLLLIVWAHGCVGLHYWLRLSRSYSKYVPVLYTIAVALPIAALAGFVSAGREARLEASDAESLAEIKLESNWPSDEVFETIFWLIDSGRAVFALILAAIALVFIVRLILEIAAPKIVIQYVSGPRVRVPKGPTLLEISRRFAVPHASVCGGRARCSTCRVRIESGLDELAPPGPTEAATLNSIKASEDVRLACQIRPASSLTVVRLLQPDMKSRAASKAEGEAQGVERTVAILFLDVRGFTSLSQDKLPYDVVYLLNAFFAAAGQAIRNQGGWIDKYLGDGLMAVFGHDSNPRIGARQALRAAREIDLSLDKVNAQLVTELGQPLKVGIGIHLGPVVMGRIGYRDSASMTVIGRTVNTASRLEALTKEKKCQFIASIDVTKAAELPTEELDHELVTVRGLSTPLEIVRLVQARDLPIEALAVARRADDTKSRSKSGERNPQPAK